MKPYLLIIIIGLFGCQTAQPVRTKIEEEIYKCDEKGLAAKPIWKKSGQYVEIISEIVCEPKSPVP